MSSQSKEPRFLVIRRGPVFYEWRYREENATKFRTTKIPRTIPPKDALDIIAHDWLNLHPGEVLNAAWELTSEEIAAGKPGMTQEQVDRLTKGFLQ